MRTDDFRPSDNVEDDRDGSASRGGGGLPGGAGGLGIGTVIIIGLISWYFGIDPSVLLNGAQILTGNGSSTQQTSPAPPVTAGRRPIRPVSSSPWCSASTEDRWTEIFSRERAKPIIRRNCACSRARNRRPCAFAQSAMGPFYCPRDQRVYLDTSFFRDLQSQVRRLHQQQGLPVLRGLCDRSRGRPSRPG